MTRWKREFRAWAKAQGLCVLCIPKDWKDIKTAKVMSQLMDYQARDMEFDKAVETAMLLGMSTMIAHT